MTGPAPRAFTDVFVARPVLAVVLSLLLVLLGGWSYTRLGVRETPAVESPVVTVTTAWLGADPAIVESEVTEVLERQLNGIDGVRTLTSVSREQTSVITVTFELERPLEDAANDVRAKVARARRDLPPDVDEPVVEKAEADAQPVLFLQVSQEGRSMLDLSEMADLQVRERLQTIPGVSAVQIFGEQRYAVRISLDPRAMAVRGVTLAQIEAALRNNNLDAPAGRLEGQATELALRVDGGLRDPAEFAALVVATVGGQAVRLGDLGRIRVGAENERTAARADGVPAVTVAVVPQANADILAIADDVYARLPAITRALPDGARVALTYDRTRPVRAAIAEVQETLWIAFGLVVLVVFAFLRDLRSTLVPALAIPVSLIGTFLFLWWAGFTVNVFTLFGLVLAIGIVVDDAIVVLEAIVRRIEAGDDPTTAAREGTRRIAFAVLATTVSLVVVFLPVVFTGGTTGRLFLEFGATVAVSIALSAGVALTLTPALAARLLRPSAPRVGEDRLTAAFVATLRPWFRRPGWVLPVLAASAIGGALGAWRVPREFFPLEDRNVFNIRVTAPEGSGFAWMDARMGELEAELMAALPERRVLLTRVAAGMGGVAASANSGMFSVPLQPKEARQRSQAEIVASLQPLLSNLTAFQAIPTQSPTVGRGFQSPVQVVLQHADFDVLTAQLPQVIDAVRRTPGLVGVSEDLRMNRPELRVVVDRDKAAALGVSIRDLARTLQVSTAELELSQFKRGSRSYPVLVGVAPELRDTPDELAQLTVRTGSGGLVPIGNLVRFVEGSASSSRFHTDRLPSATISANLDGIPLGEALARVSHLADGLPEGFRLSYSGESRDYLESATGLTGVLGLALALVYLTLAAQFDSFVDPVAVLLAVPAALAGALGALWVVGSTLSFFSQVGLILLVGLVAKNGILIVEVAHQLRDESGLDRWDAAFEAARLRFRPIVMTSLATIGGAVPIALGFSSESRAPLGVAVVAGLFVSTAVSLYVTPIVYAALGSIADRRLSRRAVAVAVAIAAAGDARGQPLDLAGALALADAQSLDLEAIAATQASADAGVGRARAALLPTLAGTVGALSGQSPQLFWAQDGPGFGVTGAARLTVPVVDLAAWSSWTAARGRMAAADAGAVAGRQEILAAVARAVIDAQRAIQAADAAQALLARSARYVALAEERATLGLAPAIEPLRARVLQAGDAARFAAAQAARDTRLVALTELIGQSLDAPVALAPPVQLVLPAPLGEVERADVTAAANAAAAAGADLRAAARAVVPTLDAYAQGSTLVSPATGERSSIEVVGLEAQFSLFAGGARSADVRAREASAQAAEVAARDLAREVRAEQSASALALGSTEATLALAREGARLAEAEVALAEDRLAQGAASQLELVDAQARLATAWLTEIDALAGWNAAVVEWLRARGQLDALLASGG